MMEFYEIKILVTLLFLNKKFKITNITINTEKNIHRNPRVNRITVNNKILYQDGYFKYEETEETNKIIKREFTEF